MKYISDRVKTGAVIAAIILPCMLISNHCKNKDDEFADTKYTEFKEKILNDSFNENAVPVAAFVSQRHYNAEKRLEAEHWLASYHQNLNKIKLEEDSRKRFIEERITKIGGYKLIEIDSNSKCNLYKG